MDSPLDQSVRTPAAGPAASGHASGAAALIRQHLAREDSAWSMGGFGALGEFLRAAGEPVERLSGDMAIVSARGALRLAPPPEARAIAHETPSADPRLWNHAIEFCLPQERAAMNRRRALTELGPDRDSLRAADRDALLFDLGLGLHQADACIRTADAALIRVLRAAIGAARGRSMLEHDHPAWADILKASPHRVFLSRVGRLEVYVPIPAPGSVPDYHFTPGPHTHVLPQHADLAVAVMDRAGISRSVTLAWHDGFGEGLARQVEAFGRHPGRFTVFGNLDFSRVNEPDFGEAAGAGGFEEVEE